MKKEEEEGSDYCFVVVVTAAGTDDVALVVVVVMMIMSIFTLFNRSLFLLLFLYSPCMELDFLYGFDLLKNLFIT